MTSRIGRSERMGKRGSGTLGAGSEVLLWSTPWEPAKGRILFTSQGFSLEETISGDVGLLGTASGFRSPTQPAVIIGQETTISFEVDPSASVADEAIVITAEGNVLLWFASGRLTTRQPLESQPARSIQPLQQATLTGTLDARAIATRLPEHTPNDASEAEAVSPAMAKIILVAFLKAANPGLGARLEDLLALPTDWDGEGAVGPTIAAGEKAVELLLHAEDAAAAASFIAPLPDGGLQIEWGPVANQKLVVAVDPAGNQVDFVYIDERGALEGTEGRLQSESDLDQFLPSLS